jgi:hypothetical protein
MVVSSFINLGRAARYATIAHYFSGVNRGPRPNGNLFNHVSLTGREESDIKPELKQERNIKFLKEAWNVISI